MKKHLQKLARIAVAGASLLTINEADAESKSMRQIQTNKNPFALTPAQKKEAREARKEEARKAEANQKARPPTNIDWTMEQHRWFVSELIKFDWQVKSGMYTPSFEPVTIVDFVRIKNIDDENGNRRQLTPQQVLAIVKTATMAMKAGLNKDNVLIGMPNTPPLSPEAQAKRDAAWNAAAKQIAASISSNEDLRHSAGHFENYIKARFQSTGYGMTEVYVNDGRLNVGPKAQVAKMLEDYRNTVFQWNAIMCEGRLAFVDEITKAYREIGWDNQDRTTSFINCFQRVFVNIDSRREAALRGKRPLLRH